MKKDSLVIVESPAKANTIKKYLGGSFQVKASVGHIKDLPTSSIGVDIEDGFKPHYQIIKGKKKVVSEIVKAATGSKEVFLATDPDREGEAIAWHIKEEIEKGAKKKKGEPPAIYRAMFHEVTPRAVKLAIQNPVSLSQNLFEAQQARRILDRLVGYKISPILWEKVRRGLSAGRVQSVALRLICEREAEISRFVPEEYWSITARLEGSNPPPFEAKLIEVNGKKVKISNEEEAKKILAAISNKEFVLSKVERSEKKRYAAPPFITSTLQQEAARRFRFSAANTMRIAQRLYEGVDMGEYGTVGLITYMRTDSVRVSDEAISNAREFIKTSFGPEFLPDKPNIYRSKKSAQEAHEAIRPTSIEITPALASRYLSKDEAALYELIWKRFVASQMVPAIFDQTLFRISAGEFIFRAVGSIMKFPGFTAVYIEDRGEKDEKDETEEEGTSKLPDLLEGESLRLDSLTPSRHFTEPPPRYTEASLIKTLEEKGIGRPSTYATILSNILGKEYVKKEKGRLVPTRLGEITTELLVMHFPEIMDVGFTASMEEELDEIEEGKRRWQDVLNDFYRPFSAALERAKREMENIKRKEIETGFKCELCGATMVIKWGKRGEFLACSNYPRCKNTKEFKTDEDGNINIIQRKETSETCPKCGGRLVLRHGRFGEFWACSNFPDCKFTKPVSLGVKCPKCGGEIVKRRTKGGRYFYGCSNYPSCDFAVWERPHEGPCPECGSPYLVERRGEEGIDIICPNKGCGFKKGGS